VESRTIPTELAQWVAAELARLDLDPAFTSQTLLVEASYRCFYRIRSRHRGGDAVSLVAMDSPPERENNQQFIALARVFATHGVGVPRILAADLTDGFLLMTDLGDRHFADVYGTGERDRALAAGIDTLIRIQTVDDPAVPPYTAQRFRDELGIFREWFVERWLGEPFPARDLAGIPEMLVACTEQQVQVCVHRDFHSRNLLFAADGSVGVVDFQDALVGPVSYDLASLLRDCYYRFPEDEIARWRNYFLERTPHALDPDQFARDLDLTAAQRQLKAVGIFARLDLRDGKPSHLTHIPPVLDHLAALAGRHETLAPLGPYLAHWQEATRQRLEAQR
jgi:aminoglycoside/choline kinase family phosphotransferase